MIRYISLLKFTEKGAENLSRSTTRARRFNALAEKSGVKVEAQFWAIGRWDGVLVLAAESEEKIVNALAGLTGAGEVRTESLRAFTADEFDSILS